MGKEIPALPLSFMYLCTRLSFCRIRSTARSTAPDENLITQVAAYVLRCYSHHAFPTQTRFHILNGIPLSRGLGSSGAAIIGRSGRLRSFQGSNAGFLSHGRSKATLRKKPKPQQHLDNVTADTLFKRGSLIWLLMSPE